MMTKYDWQRLVGVMSLFGVVGIAACDEPDDGDLDSEVMIHGEAADDDHLDFTPVDETVTFRFLAENGTAMNGSVLNSKLFNSKLFNSKLFNGTALGAAVTRVNGARTAAVELGGAALTNIQLINGSLLSGFDSGAGATKIGAQLTNTVFKVDFDPLATGSGEQLTFKITSVVQSAVQSDVYFHTVEQLNADDEFETLCRDGAGAPTQAIALPGTWDPDTAIRQGAAGKFTWGCRGASLAKAVEWGYRPWASAQMNDAHQAAMRMIRADYCGVGVTYTSNGNAIDVSDKWDIQVSDTTWPVEAKWGPNGAVCLNTPRKLWYARSSIPCAATLPYCTDNGLADGAQNTDPAQFGGLLMTRAVPNDNPSAY